MTDSGLHIVAAFPRDGSIAEVRDTNIAAALRNADRGRLSMPASDGAEHLLVFERIPMSHWVAVSSLPRADVEGPARRTAAIYAVGALLLSIPSLLFATWLGLRLVRSMQSMAHFASSLGDDVHTGHRHVPKVERACGELSVVAERLEKAACDIAARDAQLRQQRDLAEANAARIARQSEDLARSNSDLEQFAYVASHDLREPLRMVSSFLTLLERHLAAHLDDEAREYMAFARDGALRMDRMILDLLEYSRVGRMEKSVGDVDLNQMVALARTELAAKLAEGGGEVEVDGELPMVRGYAGELSRLLLNLIGNGLKYRAPDRVPRVVVSARPIPEGWEVSVADNGIGIDPQFFERIFAIFQRLHTRQQYEGNGIGLAICKKVVEHHGGHIWVESEKGKGSVFRFTLASPQPPR
ncbi:MAG TPA: ATP-binding protein [Magnetospirillum sp.]|nr:ATP-binding protein [Magnetospirillum sp.]